MTPRDVHRELRRIARRIEQADQLYGSRSELWRLGRELGVSSTDLARSSGVTPQLVRQYWAVPPG